MLPTQSRAWMAAQPGLSTCTIFSGTLFVSRDRNSFKKANSISGVIKRQFFDVVQNSFQHLDFDGSL